MKFPNFEIESFFVDNNIEWKTHNGDDHIEYAVNCPMCQERGEPTPDTKQRLWINYDKGTFHCYRCAWTGTLTRMVQGFLKTNYLNAIKIVRGRLMDSLEFMNLKLHVEKFENFDEDLVVREVDLPHGYEPIEGPHPYLKMRGVPWEYARDNDWGISKAGYTENRLIVPTFMENQLVFWQARLARDVREGERKVLNPTGASARHVLWNYDIAKEYERVILVEGFMDGVKVGPDAMATNGKTIHVRQVEALQKTKAKEIVIMYDRDTWEDGKRGKPCSMEKAVKTLRMGGFLVKAVRMPDDRDPGDYKFHSKKLRRMIDDAKVPNF